MGDEGKVLKRNTIRGPKGSWAENDDVRKKEWLGIETRVRRFVV